MEIVGCLVAFARRRPRSRSRVRRQAGRKVRHEVGRHVGRRVGNTVRLAVGHGASGELDRKVTHAKRRERVANESPVGHGWVGVNSRAVRG